MIYLSGLTLQRMRGQRPDVGLMLSFGGATVGRDRRSQILGAGLWAADNGCFKNPDLDVADYLRWLEAHRCGLLTCLFAVAPDVVGDCRETKKRALPVLKQIRALGYRAAYVAQDGQENYPLDYDLFDCLFIGGSTEWKLSEGAFWLVGQAKKRGKWTHMGRVNSRRRLRIAKQAGCDSADGTHACFGPDKRMGQMYGWLDELKQQPFLPEREEDEAETDLIVDLNLLY